MAGRPAGAWRPDTSHTRGSRNSDIRPKRLVRSITHPGDFEQFSRGARSRAAVFGGFESRSSNGTNDATSPASAA